MTPKKWSPDRLRCQPAPPRSAHHHYVKKTHKSLGAQIRKCRYTSLIRWCVFFHMKDLQILFKYLIIFVPLYIPEPSKGCQMVPKGCHFTIPYRVFVGTPFKVLVCSIYFNLASLQRFEKRVTPGTKCSHMECYYSWKSCLAKSSSFSVASPLFVKKQAPASSKWPFDTWNGGYDSPLIKSDQGHFENHLA